MSKVVTEEYIDLLSYSAMDTLSIGTKFVVFICLSFNYMAIKPGKTSIITLASYENHQARHRL